MSEFQKEIIMDVIFVVVIVLIGLGLVLAMIWN